MNLRTDEPIILYEKSCDENEKTDYFNLYPKAKGIVDFLKNEGAKEVLNKNNLIALYGEWGSGKSSIMKTIESKLDTDKFKTIMFETWMYEKDDNLSFSIFDAIVDEIIKGTDAVKEALVKEMIETFKSFKVGLTFKTPLLDVSVEKGDAPVLKESLYTKIKSFLDEFSNMIEEYSEDKKIVVFVDDLDRCEDENIINLLIY